MSITTVTVAGAGGVLGSQIAFQVAYYGFKVIAYDINEKGIQQAQVFFERLGQEFIRENHGSEALVQQAMSRIQYQTDLVNAVKSVDLIIEAIPEVLAIKKEFYQKVSQYASKDTILASNSSTMIPSMILEAVSYPERYLHMHFANKIWLRNICEVMRHSGTDQAIFEEVMAFAKAIHMVPVAIYKEQPGYILNSLLVPIIRAAHQLVVDGVADPHSVDKTWMISTGSTFAPFIAADLIGPTTIYNIMSAAAKNGDELSGRMANYIQTEMIDKGRMGIANGKGYYDYPNPAFQDPDFLK